MQILQLNFQVTVSCRAYMKECVPVAEMIAQTPGLIWKAWIFNEETNTAGGIYLFEDKAALEAYLQGPVMEGLRNSPAFSDITVNRFDVLSDLSKVTRFDVTKQRMPELEVALD